MKTEFSIEKYFGLGRVPIGIGAVLKGWDIKKEDFRDSTRLPVVDFRAMTNACPHDCFHCFTDKNPKTLKLEEIKEVIDQLADLKCHAIDYLGEGEPTIDKDFFPIIEHTSSKGIIPIVFTDAATRLRNKTFVKKLYESGASICPKCDSLWNREYQNWVVRDRTGKYFDQRNEALNLLIEEGFNKPEKDGTTRLGFDMVISSRNADEVEKTLRFCRDRNLWAIFAFHLPSGRSGREDFDKSLVVSDEQRKAVRETVARVDVEYDFKHPIRNNFATFSCVELMCIYGDGRVSPCVGNEQIIGNVRTDSIEDLHKKILRDFPCHNPETFDGNCIYRPRI